MDRQVRNHNQAVKPLEELYAIDPADADTVGKLRDIYSKRRSWRALLDLERKELERLKSPGGAADARLGEMAKLAADRLGDAREAIAIWNRVLEGAPDDGEALADARRTVRARPALAGAHRDLEAAGAPKRRRAQDAGRAAGEGGHALLGEAAAIRRKAVEAYQEIVRLMPSHQKAMRTLRELYAEAGRYAELEALYRGQGQ